MEPEESVPSEQIHTLPSPPRKSSMIFHPPKRYLGIILEDVEKMFLIRNGVHGDDPNTYNKATLDIDSEKWLEAMKSKIDSMHSN